MTYIVNDKCIKCKLMDCVEVCPVDCFYEGKNMLVIKPDECIDCGVCEPECPVDAIKPDTEDGSEKWLELNKNEEKPDSNAESINIACLLIHAAKIDENYTSEEKEIIKKTVKKLYPDLDDLDEVIVQAERKENDSNHIQEFTREVKSLSTENKIIIVETLWRIILSDGKSDVYENNLMRRLAGLLYLDDKIVGETKVKILNNK